MNIWKAKDFRKAICKLSWKTLLLKFPEKHCLFKTRYDIMSQKPPQAAKITLPKIIGSGRNLNLTYIFWHDIWICIFNLLHVYTVPEKLGSKKGKPFFFKFKKDYFVKKKNHGILDKFQTWPAYSIAFFTIYDCNDM